MSNFENATLGHTLARGFWQSVTNKLNFTRDSRGALQQVLTNRQTETQTHR